MCVRGRIVAPGRAGDEADEAANRPDIEESSHGDAAVSVRTREDHHQKGKPEPAGKRADKTGEKAEDEAHEQDVSGRDSRLDGRRLGVIVVLPGFQVSR